MPLFLRACAVILASALAACAHAPRTHVVYSASSCIDRATDTFAQNVWAIRAHRYAEASTAAEDAARMALTCANKATGSSRTQARWRAANALVVSAELAHQAKDTGRARRLLREGYAIMHSVRPPRTDAFTSTLVAQKLDVARR
ncbi:MAG TPA: hypothetical protein VFE17_13525, partial [Candidatus Baltobacteraceae bacterium]|nr:hypothetical protein [Candidatus Baltobacteraceae bacterium]